MLDRFFKREYMDFTEIKIELENEHKAIYNCYQKLTELHRSSVYETERKPKVENLLLILFDFCTTHFKKEEAFAHVLNLNFKHHKYLHNNFLMKLKKLINRYQRNLTSLGDVLFFVKNWLKTHINKMDKIDFAQIYS